jgi:hypothetical protein
MGTNMENMLKRQLLQSAFSFKLRFSVVGKPDLSKNEKLCAIWMRPAARKAALRRMGYAG